MLECLCNNYQFPEDGKLTNKNNETPFHYVLKVKRSELSERVCSLLSNYNIDPNVIDIRGKKAGSHIGSSMDKRIKVLREAAERIKGQQSKAKGKSKGKRRKHWKGHQTGSSNSSPVKSNVAMPNLPEPPVASETLKPTKSMTVEDPTLVSVRECLQIVLHKSDSYFVDQHGHSRTTKKQPVAALISMSEDQQRASTKEPTEGTELQSTVPECEHEPRVDSDTEPLSNNDSTFLEFEDLPWEVECPEKVVRFFKDKRVPRKVQEQAVRKIQMLASGEWRKKLIKPVGRKVQHLYEARITKSARILWEVVVQFSPRCTEKSDQGTDAGRVKHVYSEVIRIWDIVLDHDNVDLSIQNIERSHELGEMACDFARDKLLPMATHSSVSERLPQKYFLMSEFETASSKHSGKEVAQYMYTPAASTKESEYNVVTFYSFSSAAIRSMLQGENERRDFPFKEWREEHDIITMPDDNESILLLGRSGTGKTTCCLYRMWNKFQNYWNFAKDSGPLVPKRVMVFLKSEQDCEESCAHDTSTSVASEGPYESSTTHMTNVNVPDMAHSLLDKEDQQDKTTELHQPIADDKLEHLHQVFITKNYVLCAQMKKRFFDMAASSKLAENHMAFEDEVLPYTVPEINDLAYPLFLTSRQFLLLLDNSLDDGKNYFPRRCDGSLAVQIISSDYDHDDSDIIIDLVESETDDENTDDEGDYSGIQSTKSTQGKLPVRKEVTASYFAEVIWPKVSYNCINKKTDPMLVWMEIKSFIKGSRQAMCSKNGYITEEEYEELGKKLAPNFVGNRNEVYMVFRKYQQYMQNHLDLFDECDCVHNIYTRMNNVLELPWSIHNFYVDEVQDFTQAELSIILRCCRNPNGLFLTGDTAQSIMRGISFRFEDLRTLFHAVQESTKHQKKSIPVLVPRVHSLTINFRSHSGILRLAASVIELLKEFFPSSFDTIPGDEGIFPGPTPALLHSCTTSDLAVLLRNRRREASQIEFGAHQVIIVQSEDTKKELPDVLQSGIVLTVFEAKGLEFDDVLLYNFFADSMVSTE